MRDREHRPCPVGRSDEHDVGPAVAGARLRAARRPPASRTRARSIPADGRSSAGRARRAQTASAGCGRQSAAGQLRARHAPHGVAAPCAHARRPGRGSVPSAHGRATARRGGADARRPARAAPRPTRSGPVPRRRSGSSSGTPTWRGWMSPKARRTTSTAVPAGARCASPARCSRTRGAIDPVGAAGDEALRDVEQRADRLDDVLVERSPWRARGAVVADEPRSQAGPLARELLAAPRALRRRRRAARQLDELLGVDDELDQALARTPPARCARSPRAPRASSAGGLAGRPRGARRSIPSNARRTPRRHAPNARMSALSEDMNVSAPACSASSSASARSSSARSANPSGATSSSSAASLSSAARIAGIRCPSSTACSRPRPSSRASSSSVRRPAGVTSNVKRLRRHSCAEAARLASCSCSSAPHKTSCASRSSSSFGSMRVA